MSFELKTKVSLSADSQALIDKFIDENKDKKEVTTHDVFALLAKAAGLMVAMSFDDGKALSQSAQKQLLVHLYETLVKNDANGFKEDARLEEIINMIFSIRAGAFEVDLGKGGWGCLPCCSSVKLSVKE